VTLHILLFNTLLDLERVNAVVRVHKKTSFFTVKFFLPLFPLFKRVVVKNLNFVDALLANVLRHDLVFLVHVDDVQITFFVGGVQLLLLIVPADAGVYRLVRVLQRNLLGALGGLEPL
jgi:hypothetical protein